MIIQKIGTIAGLLLTVIPHAFAQTTPSAASTPAAPAPVASARKAIDDFQSRIVAARKAGKFADFEAAMQLYVAPDCTFDVNGSTHTYNEDLDRARHTLTSPLPIATISTRTVTVTGTDARASGTTDFSAPYVDTEGYLGAKGVTHQVETKGIYSSHWVMTEGAWKLHYLSDTDTRTFVDGKLYVPPKVKGQRRNSATPSYRPVAAIPTLSQKLPTVLRQTKVKRPRAQY